MSIRRYLTLILLSVITLVTFAAAIQGYRGSMAKATSVFDNELRSLTYVLVNITDMSTQSLAPQPDAAWSDLPTNPASGLTPSSVLLHETPSNQPDALSW